MNHTWTQQEIDDCVANNSFPLTLTNDIFVGLDLQKVFKKSSIVENCMFNNCNFTEVKFYNSMFSFTRFIDCNLTSATFTSSNLCFVEFKSCISEDINFKHTHFQSCTIKSPINHVRTIYYFCNVYDTVINTIDTRHLWFGFTTFAQCTFQNSGVHQRSFIDCFMKRTTFENCNIFSSDQTDLIQKDNTYVNCKGDELCSALSYQQCTLSAPCTHSWKLYRGITQTYAYCEVCNKKRVDTK